MDKISLGLPVYNGGLHLEETICFWLSQPYENIELIISDNASTDNTAEICEKYLKDPRVRYFRQGKNIGWKNFVFVASQATSNYFMFVTDDDFWDEDVLFRLKSFLDEKQKSGKKNLLVYGRHQAFKKDAEISHFANRKLVQFNMPIFKFAWHVLTYATNGATNVMFGLWSNKNDAISFAEYKAILHSSSEKLSLEVGPDSFALGMMREKINIYTVSSLKHYRRHWARQAGFFEHKEKKRSLIPKIIKRYIKYWGLLFKNMNFISKSVLILVFPFGLISNYILRKANRKL